MRGTALILVALALAPGCGYKEVDVPQTIVQSVFSGRSDDPTSCAGKRTCVMLFEAPWCGACKHLNRKILTPMRQIIAEELPHTGLLLVAVSDEQEKLEAFAKQLGAPYVTDPSGAWMRPFGIRSIPSFVIVDAAGKGKIVGNDFGAKGRTPREAVRSMLKDRFGIKS